MGQTDRAGVARAERFVGMRWWLAALERAVRYLGTVAALVVLYYGSAHLGYAVHFAGPVASIVWLPVGVGIAFLYLAGLEFWPGVVLGDLLVNNYSALPVGSALGQTTGNLIEVLVATVLMRRLLGRGSQLETVGQVARLVLAISAGTALSASIGSLSLRLGHVISADALPGVLRTWWLGDFSGALIVVPLALAWGRPVDREFWRGRWVEGILALLAVVSACELVLRGRNPLAYLVFPVLIWVALRFRQRGATLAVLVTSGFAVWATTYYGGQFSSHSLTRIVLETQLFIAVASVTTLILAGVVSERERFADGLWASRIRLLEAVDAERRRLERDLHDGIQQDLVGIRVRLERAAEVTESEPARGRQMIAAVGRQMDDTLSSVRALARGINPALLDGRGVAEALKSAARRVPLSVSVRASAIGRYSEDIEHAVYFCCLEALQNTVKHAGPDADVVLRLWTSASWVHFEVSDSGVGFDPAEAAAGSGLTNMQDRIAAVGGTLTIDSRHGNGTTIRGRVPAALGSVSVAARLDAAVPPPQPDAEASQLQAAHR